MKYRFKSLRPVIDLFEYGGELGASEIADKLGKSRVIVHKYLKELVEQKKLEKIGKGPKVKYKSTSKNIIRDNYDIKYIPDFSSEKILDEIFFKFSPEGKILKGFNGLNTWCNSRGLNVEEKLNNYLSIYNYINKTRDSCFLLSAKKSFGKHFEKVYLDDIYYADQYKWMEFGRGKLAEMTFYAKQSQNKKLILESIGKIILKLKCIIRKKGFDAIAITPWSIDRKNQLLGILKNELKDIGLPFVNIIKYYPNDIAIPQKSLKTREQRINNARNTIFIDDKNIGKYSKVFLIDDFVGSGSTLNETASKLKIEGVKEVYGFAFVGNLNLEYDVINEV